MRYFTKIGFLHFFMKLTFISDIIVQMIGKLHVWKSSKYYISRNDIVPLCNIILSFKLSISPKESGLLYRLGVIAQSDQGQIRHCMFPRENTAPYAPL